MSDLAKQIIAAKKTLRAQKRTDPWLFDEYRTVVALKQRIEVLQAMLAKAERAWKELGK